jgi:neutral ceramidase
VNQGKLFESNINRSPTSYLLNPQEERDAYAEDGDTDKTMLLLNFVSVRTRKSLGVLNWFAVHATSMNNTNTMISGDNKGYAAYALEKGTCVACL